MKNLTLKRRLFLHSFVPVTAVFIINNLFLLTLETPGYAIVSAVFYGIAVSISILLLSDFKLKEPKSDLSEEDLERHSQAINESYTRLKSVLADCCQKESLPIARELAAICRDLGPVAGELKEMSDKKKETRGPLGQGSLRRAFRIAA